MRISNIIVIVVLAWTTYSAPLVAAPLTLPSQRAEVKLAYGVNEVKAGALMLRIVRAQVGTLSASDFDTYTVFVASAKRGDPWLHVTMPAAKGLGYNLRDYQTGNANTQATAFYRDGEHLYAVQAMKVRAEASAKGSVKTPFDMKVFVFNDNDEVPMFDDEGLIQTKKHYVDAREALHREFFQP